MKREDVKNIVIDGTIKFGGYFALLSIMIVPFIFFYHSIPLLEANSLVDILFSSWEPDKEIFGLSAFIVTTLILGLVSTAIAFIISLSISLYIYEYKEKKSGKIIVKIIETMSGIPTVVYGFIGVILLIPFIRDHTDSPTGYSLIATVIMLSILIIPTIVLYITQSFNSLPENIKYACFSLGATRAQFYYYTLIPSSLKGIAIALILGFSRAISDTMLAIMISGNALKFPSSLLESSRALTAHIALVLPGEFDGIEFKAVFFTSLLLIIIIFIFNLMIKILDRK